jgi:ribulose-phosphate 3-epimerase
MTGVKIAPSIVSADLAHLADQLKQCEDVGAEYIHIDVMDGQFVPAITIGWPIVERVHSRGVQAGICLNPPTPVEALDRILPDIDQVMVMSVNPGRSGQSFIEDALPKIKHFHRVIHENGYRATIEVDGGVKPDNAPHCAAAGANILVAASAIFNDSAPIAANIAALRRAAL